MGVETVYNVALEREHDWEMLHGEKNPKSSEWELTINCRKIPEHLSSAFQLLQRL